MRVGFNYPPLPGIPWRHWHHPGLSVDLLLPRWAEPVLAAAAQAWLRSTSVLGGGESTFLMMGKPLPETQRAFIRGGSGRQTRAASAGMRKLHPM